MSPKKQEYWVPSHHCMDTGGTCEYSGLGTWVPCLSEPETQASSSHSVVRSHRPPSLQSSPTSVPSTPAIQASSRWKPAAMPDSSLSPSPPKQVLPAPDFPPAPPQPPSPSLAPRHCKNIDSHSHPGPHSAAKRQNDDSASLSMLTSLPAHGSQSSPCPQSSYSSFSGHFVVQEALLNCRPDKDP